MLTTYIEAEYESGYIHVQDEQDHSPFVYGKNIFNDILEKRPEAGHGKMVRFSLIHDGVKYDVDWRGLPDNARPIRFIRYEADFDTAGNLIEKRLMGIDFGYQFNDELGENHQEIKTIGEGAKE